MNQNLAHYIILLLLGSLPFVVLFASTCDVIVVEMAATKLTVTGEAVQCGQFHDCCVMWLLVLFEQDHLYIKIQWA